MEHPLVDDSPTKTVSGKLGRYELVKRLAQSETAELLLARTGGRGFERHLVIKRLGDEQAKDAAFVKTFIAEARRASELHHRNIVQVQDVGESGGKPYVAMEYVHGEDLRKLLARLRGRNQPIPLQHLVAIGTSVAAALHHAHDQTGADRKSPGIVHAGVTPANILVGYDGNVKLVDFGIAKAAIQAMEAHGKALEGKAPYMAPEQCTGHEVDRRSDVFALGTVLYELATARRLFKGESDFLTMAAIVGGTVPRPSLHRKDLPGEVEDIILKALSRAPADRYQTAAELRTALDGFAKKAALAYSLTSLAGYMTQLFGKRPEPWHDSAEGTGVTVVEAAVPTVDFDGAALGLAEAPAEAVEMFAIPDGATNDSPIAHAHGRAVTDNPTAVIDVEISQRSAAVEATSESPIAHERAGTEASTVVVNLALNNKKSAALEASAPKTRPASNTSPPRPASNTSPPPRPASNTSPPPRPASNTSPPPRPASNTSPPPRPASNTSPPPRPASNTSPPPRPASNTSPPRPASNTSPPRLASNTSPPGPSERPSKPEASTGSATSADTDGKVTAVPSEVKTDQASKTAGHRLPPPLRTPRSIPVTASLSVAPPAAAATTPAPPATSPAVASAVELPATARPAAEPPESDRLPTDVDDNTAVANPPPPPIRITGSKAAHESTQIVAPLPLNPPAKRASRASTPPALGELEQAKTEGKKPKATGMTAAARRTWIKAGAIGAGAIAVVILVVAIGFSSDDVTPVSAPASPDPTAATPPEAKPQPAEPPPEPPRPERTMRNSEPPPEPPPASDVAAQAPAEPPPEPPRPERTMRNSEPPPTKTTEPPPTKTTEPPAKTSEPPTKVAAPPSRPSRPPTELASSPPKRAKPTDTTRTAAQTTKPAAKPPTKPAKQTKTPAYDPNSLFLKKP